MKLNIPQAMLENRAYSSDSVAFNAQLPGRSAPVPHTDSSAVSIPPAIKILPDGRAECNFYAPDAKTVSVGHVLGEQVPLKKGDGGLWTGILESEFPGFKVIVFQVDGVAVMNPYAPIAFGYGRPVNYIDIPCPEQDYLMLKDVPHGTVTREYFKSSVTGEYESCLVYLPPCYRDDPNLRLPVLYLQHGGSQNENCWIYEAKTNFIMDNLLAEGKANPFIIVMNNGMVQVKDENGGWNYNSDKLQDLLVNDCIPFIDSHYGTLSDTWNRAYAGLSMGSLQGSRFFLERRDVIASAGLFTGYSSPRATSVPAYMSALDDAEAFNKSSRLFFIAAGRNEPAGEKVEKESEELTKKGINHVCRVYPGAHEWHVWRACLHEFAQLLFR